MKLQFEATRLESGLRVVTAAMPHVESVAMGVW
jgi:predicted Zn-dependent peptidase